MEMHQVRYFLAVADTLNFTRAAELCHVSQPALTRAIQQLEEELGGLLLRRERKLTHLTDFGRLLEPHLRQLAADAEAAKTTAKRFLSLFAGADPAGRDVHGRAGGIHGVSCRLSQRQPRLRDHPPRGRAKTAVYDANGGRARRGRYGAAGTVQRTVRRVVALSRALLHRLSDGTPAGAAEACSRRGRGGRDLFAPHQLRVPRLPRGPPARARARDQRRVRERARGLDPDDGRGRLWGLLSARVLANDPRRAHAAAHRPGSGPRGILGVDVRPA